MNDKYENKIMDLCRVNKLGEIKAEQLIEIGICSANELANADSDEVFEKLNKLESMIKDRKNNKSTKRVIEKWIEEAKTREYEYSKAKRRYTEIKKRSNDEKLRQVLFNLLNDDKKELNIKEIDFNANIEVYKESFNNDMAQRRKRNSKLAELEIINKDNIKQFEKEHDKFFEKNLPYEKFKEFYGKDDDKRRCAFCEITEDEINDLLSKEKIYTNRIYSRGRSLEIDKIKPEGGYVDGNIQLCCYWCNNAKTDEYNNEEFKEIGLAIKKIWDKRKS